MNLILLLLETIFCSLESLRNGKEGSPSSDGYDCFETLT